MEKFRPPGPMQFEGNVSTEWNRFKKLFEIFIKATTTDKTPDDETKIAMLLNLMGEKALDIFETFSLTTADKKNYDKVIGQFDSYCSPKDYVIYERFKFHSRKQQPGELFENFLTDISNQAQKCDFEKTNNGTITEQMIRDRIVMGVNNPDIQEKLLRVENLNLKKAIEFCRIAEATHRQAREFQQTVPVNEIRYQSSRRDKKGSVKSGTQWRQEKKTDEQQKVKVKNCSRCSFSHNANRCPAYGKKCRKCGRFNHFSLVCKNKKIQDISNRGNENCNDYYNSSLEFDIDNLVINSIQVDSVAKGNNGWFKKLKVENREINFKLDSGSDVNVLPVMVFKEFFCSDIEVKPTDTNLQAYGGFNLNVLGVTFLKVSYNEKLINEPFIIVDTLSSPVLGLSACVKLNLIMRIDEVAIKSNENDKIKFLTENKEVFLGLGCFPGRVKIQLKQNTAPIVSPPRRIPLSLKEKVKNKLKEMEKANIIEKVDYPTDWVHNLVIIEKPDKSIRLCLDPRNLNTFVKREPFEIPNLEDLTSRLEGMTYFTVMDLKDGFWQVQLESESSELCTFNTPFGCYKFLRLPFGLNSAPEIFQKLTTRYFGDLSGTFPYFDDILVFGKTKQEHDENLMRVVNRARELNIKFNDKKLQYCQNKVKYLGHIFSKHGIQIDKDRIRAIEVMKEPTNKKELQTFFGFVNYLRNFIPNMAELTSTLRDLLRKDVPFQWLPCHSSAFKQLKSVITKAPTLQNFREKIPVLIQTDASQKGLGSCLMQMNKPICYASKALSRCEEKYAQIEKEMLAIVFACKKFHNYIYGRKVTVLTDHKPLVGLFKKSISEIPSNRLQRMRLNLLKYELDVQYVPGKFMFIADTLSRNFDSENSDEVDSSLNEVVHSINITDRRLEQIKSEIDTDYELSLLREIHLKGWPSTRSKVNDILKKYWLIRDEIYYENGLLFYKNRVIIPYNLRKDILNVLHESHMGITKTKEAAKGTVYWPNITQDIENLVFNCRICEKYQKSNYKLPLIPHKIPNYPFNKVACDIFEYKGQNYLVLIDYYSKWLEVKELKNKTSNEVIKHLKSIFSIHGIPENIVSDNNPFNSYEFNKFAEAWHITVTTSSPGYPRSNGLAERGVSIAKKLLRKCEEDNKEFASALLAYRSTPVAGLPYTPSQLLMSRNLRTKLPIKNELLKPRVVNDAKIYLEQSQIKYKYYHDRKIGKQKEKQFKRGENVVVQRGKHWEPAKVISSHKLPRSYFVQTESNNILRRNSTHLRHSQFEPIVRTSCPEDLNDSQADHTSPSSPQSNENLRSQTTNVNSQDNLKESQNNYVTRYGRVVKPPDRYTFSSDNK